jgi:nitrite reductase/ring-hydroxylating ferredoxin subunit
MDSPQRTRVAVYARRVGASLERVWENVLDWEHLPWLHAGSFRQIERRDAGPWGWRARAVLEPRGGEIELELLTEPAAGRYVTRTLAGEGAGSEIWTTLRRVGPAATDVTVAFDVAGVSPDRAEQVGAGYVRLYARLWDEDEAMMQRRERELAKGRAHRAPDPPLDLGPLAELAPRLPLIVRWSGRPWRVVDQAGELLAHATVCPHRLGPLGGSPLTDGQVRCPWHGYRFDVRTGGCLEVPGLRLPEAPQVVVAADGEVTLAPPAWR